MDPSLLIKDNFQRILLNYYHNNITNNHSNGFSATSILSNNGVHHHQQRLQLQPYHSIIHEQKQLNENNNINSIHQQWPFNQNFNVHWCLWIQQQAGIHFRNLLQHYDDLNASIENYLKLKSSISDYHQQQQQQKKSKVSTTIKDIDENDIQISNKNLIQSNVDLNNNKSIKNGEGNRQSPSPSIQQQQQDDRIIRPFQCDWPDCDRRFQTAQILNHHRRFHIRKSNYQCKHCSVRLLNSEEFDEHLLKCENNLKERRSIIIVDEKRDSSSLSPSSSSPSFPAINGDQEYFSCYSSSSSSSSSQSSSTMMVATDEDPFETLNRKFLIDQLISPKNSKNRDLKKALLAIQTNDLNSKDFKSKSSMTTTTVSSSSNEYKRTRYSGIGRYRCPWPDCSYTPHFLRDLRRHMFKHTGDKRYKCPQCRFVSVWKTSLLQHQRKKHHDHI